MAIGNLLRPAIQEHISLGDGIPSHPLALWEPNLEIMSETTDGVVRKSLSIASVLGREV